MKETHLHLVHREVFLSLSSAFLSSPLFSPPFLSVQVFFLSYYPRSLMVLFFFISVTDGPWLWKLWDRQSCVVVPAIVKTHLLLNNHSDVRESCWNSGRLLCYSQSWLVGHLKFFRCWFHIQWLNEKHLNTWCLVEALIYLRALTHSCL